MARTQLDPWLDPWAKQQWLHPQIILIVMAL